MANQFKNLWLVLVLLAAGAVIFSLSLGNKKPVEQGVVLQEVFNQKPAANGETVAAVDPVPSPAIVTSPDASGKEEGYAVQVYSFQEKIRAEKAILSLKSAGYKVYMEVSNLGDNNTWYRVRIGGLENEEQAKAMLEEIRKNYNGGFIVKPKA